MYKFHSYDTFVRSKDFVSRDLHILEKLTLVFEKN